MPCMHMYVCRMCTEFVTSTRVAAMSLYGVWCPGILVESNGCPCRAYIGCVHERLWVAISRWRAVACSSSGCMRSYGFFLQTPHVTFKHRFVKLACMQSFCANFQDHRPSMKSHNSFGVHDLYHWGFAAQTRNVLWWLMYQHAHPELWPACGIMVPRTYS